MLFEIEDVKLQRQIELVQEELREIRLMKELFFGQSSDGDAYLLWQEQQIQRRTSFLERVKMTAAQLHAEAGRDLEDLILELKWME